MESGESTKKLMESLLVVRAPSIARWNEHKDVKEDKEREPFYFRGQKTGQETGAKGTGAGDATTQQSNKRETLLYRYGFKKKTTTAAIAAQAVGLFGTD